MNQGYFHSCKLYPAKNIIKKIFPFCCAFLNFLCFNDLERALLSGEKNALNTFKNDLFSNYPRFLAGWLINHALCLCVTLKNPMILENCMKINFSKFYFFEVLKRGFLFKEKLLWVTLQNSAILNCLAESLMIHTLNTGEGKHCQ